MGGKKLNGVVVISPDQSFDLTTRDSAWVQSRMDAALRGDNNPIFTGALGMHKNVPIHEHERVATSVVWGPVPLWQGPRRFSWGAGARPSPTRSRRSGRKRPSTIRTKSVFAPAASTGSASRFSTAPTTPWWPFAPTGATTDVDRQHDSGDSAAPAALRDKSV